jgi:hypothetical protein
MASSLAAGSFSSLKNALLFQSVAEGAIGLAFATAAFPALSAAAAAGDKRLFKRIFMRNAVSIGALSLCAGVGLFVMSRFVVSLFFGGGAYDEIDVSRTSMFLALLALSLPVESLVELWARAIFATQNTIRVTIAGFAFFASGIATTYLLSAPLDLAAIPIGYTVGRVVQLSLLAIFLGPRIAQIGGSSRWTRALVHDRWGDVRRREPLSAGRAAILAVCLLSLTGGTAFAAAQVVTSAGAPEITPWARVNGTRPPVIAEVTATPAESLAVESIGPVPTTTPGVFVMDLYRPGDFVGEAKDTWCVPAAM